MMVAFPDQRDEFDEYLAKRLRDPEFRAAYELAEWVNDRWWRRALSRWWWSAPLFWHYAERHKP